jgi:GGDEF domain-containing protein
LVDDVARLHDGRFLLILPRTNKAGAQIAANRVVEGVRRLMGGANAGWVRADVFGAREDLGAIKDLCDATLAPEAGSGPFEAAA